METSQRCPPQECLGGTGRLAEAVRVVLLSRPMASCRSTAALSGQVVTLSFSGDCHSFTFKKLCKNLLIKQNMKQDIWILFL